MSNLYTPTTIKSVLAAVISVFSLSVNAAAISNSVGENSIIIDANINDWASVSSLGYDANTLADVNAKADYLEGWMAHDNTSLYVAYRNNGDIDGAAWWAWQVYIDTDLSTATGYKGVDGVGADYLLQGAGLYKYTGSGTNWSWQFVSGTSNAKNGAIAEFKIPRSSLGSPSKYRAVFKARNSAFTGDYSASGIDTYPKSFAPLRLHDDLLFRQSAIWGENGGTLSMRLSAGASAGSTQLQMNNSYPLLDDQLITYLASNGEYYTAQVDTANGRTITLKSPLVAGINSGQNVWNFYENGSHPNEYGYRAIADFALRKVGVSNLNTGRHVMLGDSWFDSPGVGERLALRLGSAVVINEGIGGNTSTQLLNRFDSDVSSHNPDFVWVIAGVNDYHNDVPTATYLNNMQGIIAKISSIGAEAVIFDSPVSQLFSGSDARRQLSHSYSEALASSGGAGFVDYEFGAVVPPPETGDVSNPKSITVDGNLSDWAELESFGVDGNDINEAGARADILEGWMAHDASTFYVAYRNDGDVDQGTWWPWQTYLDTDNDVTTGFKVGNGLGANYIIQGGGLYKYSGNGSDWSWRYVATANYRIARDVVELAFSRAAINSPSSLSAMMKARNGIFTGNFAQSGIDSYPNIGSGHFSYKFTDDPIEPEDRVISNRLNDYSINVNGSLSDWSTVTSFGRDPDDISNANNLVNTQADWLETWAAHDNNNLFFAYQNDGAIGSVVWPWQIFIDADNDPSTGYKVTNSIGAEFILEGPNLRRYGGTGSNWSWNDVGVTPSSTLGSISEIAIPRNLIPELSDFRVIFKANNQAFTGSFDASGVDYFPNNAATSTLGYFSYSMQ